ncbi:MAG TPA: hypothetical protein VMV38_01855 [Candidatus Paceibacterota bacterium]|nr:hypothetical protein [Candidatus Paceibacterota bacterium]
MNRNTDLPTAIPYFAYIIKMAPPCMRMDERILSKKFYNIRGAPIIEAA